MKWIVSALLLALGLAAGGWCIGHGFEAGRNARVVSVKGLAERDRLLEKLTRAMADDFPEVSGRVSRMELGPPVGWPVQYRVSAQTTEQVRRAADQLAKDGIKVDVVDLRTVRPMDVEAIKTSVEKTNRAVVLEEGWEICGIGTQVVDYIQRDCFDLLDAPVIRVHQADVPMPYAKNLERAAKPDVPKTIAAVRKVMYLD